jgi:signal transduction histidine kinase
MISQLAIPKIVLLKNDFISTHAVRQSLRRARLLSTLNSVATPVELAEAFERNPVDMILAGANGFDGLDVPEILSEVSRRAAGTPIVLIGGDEEEVAGMRSWREGVEDYVRISQLDRLPLVLDRVMREQRTRTVSARVQSELDRAAEILRENQKMITIGRMTASIAHEINNPLESITNLLYLMEVERDLPQRVESYLRMAQRELTRVVNISKQTLTFSRETTSPVRVQLYELIEEVLGLYGRRIADKSLRVVRQFSAIEPVTVFPGEMRQVLSNLIANAIEASHPGGALKLRLRPARNWSDEGVRGVRLSVADDGVGMPVEVRSRLGEPFFTTKGQQGTGLGLWVTRSILNRYGGTLGLRSSTSAERHGTVFSMFLPTNLRPQAVLTRGLAPAATGEDHSKSGAGGAARGGDRKTFQIRASGD